MEYPAPLPPLRYALPPSLPESYCMQQKQEQKEGLFYFLPFLWSLHPEADELKAL